MYRRENACHWLASAGAAVLMGVALTQHAWANGSGGGGGGGEFGTGAHQHLDLGFEHDHYYYDRGYAVQRPPAGGVANLIGQQGERYYFYRGNWYRWRGDWYRSWGGAWVVVDAPVGLLVPTLPPYYTTLWWSGISYYYANETYYVSDAARNGYEVVAPPDTRRLRSYAPAALKAPVRYVY
jgi:hypothetical protein